MLSQKMASFPVQCREQCLRRAALPAPVIVTAVTACAPYVVSVFALEESSVTDSLFSQLIIRMSVALVCACLFTKCLWSACCVLVAVPGLRSKHVHVCPLSSVGNGGWGRLCPVSMRCGLSRGSLWSPLGMS